MPRPSQPRFCRDIGCDTRVILAKRDVTDRWIALEARDQPAFTEQSAGCLVIVDGTAWRPVDLIDHFMTRFEIAEPQARALVADYPFHRPHHHERAESGADKEQP